MAWSSATPPPGSPIISCVTLRQELEELYFPRDNIVPPERTFFPRSHIENLFTKERIQEVLECNCSTCCQHRCAFRGRSPIPLTKITGKARDGQPKGSGALILFALLVYIRCPSLIYSFMSQGLDDQYFVSHLPQFTADYIQQSIWSPTYKKLANDFHWTKFRFFIPSMKSVSNDDVEVYPEWTILPLVNETQLGYPTKTGGIVDEGNFASVFAFEILDEYNEFTEFPGLRRFVRKELRADTDPYRFRAEYENLLYVKRLQDDHLVKIVKAYKLGKHYNFIFPREMTNLRLYLRGQQSHPCLRSESIVGHPLWRQMLGVARGLNKVLNYEEPHATHEASMIGYHCDLKPANILVRESGTLLISDFGQAIFKKVAGTNSSNVFGVGGTEAYAPPEIDNAELKLNRKYDIWSLGCILVEVCMFVVGGSGGVGKLDCARLTEIPGRRNRDDRFFRHNSMTNSYELKPEVMRLIREVPDLVQGSLERDFLNEILLVALQMLHVEVKPRWTSMQVCINLARILDRFQSIPLAEPVLPNLSVKPPWSEVEVGRELTERLQSINYNVKGFWDSGPVRFTQVGMLLHMQVWDRKAWTENSLGQRSQLRLVLRFALRNPPSHYNSDAQLYLSPGRVGQFSTNNSADRLLLQEILLGFEVVKSMELEAGQVEVKHRVPMLKKFQRKSSGESGSWKYDLEVDAFCIQLWKESSCSNMTSMISPASSSRKQSPRVLRVGPRPRRIVVFYEHSVLVIRLAKNFRIQPPNLAGGAATSLGLVLTDRSRDPSFRVSVFKKEAKEPLPSFPLHREVFEAEEVENMVECTSLTMNFHSVDDAKSFYSAYRKLKRDWAEDLKSFESVQKRIGPELGYGV